MQDILVEVLAKPIAYQRIFKKITGRATAAIMLSQAWYWMPRTNDAEGWFWKTQEEWEEETGLTRDEQETARKRLKELGFMSEERRGLPARMYYKVEIAAVHQAIHDAVCGTAAIKNGASLPDKNGGLPQSYNTENTYRDHSASQEALSGEPNCTFSLDTLDQYPPFLLMSKARKKEARFNCPECGAKGSIGILDRVSPCCNCRIDWRNNDILAKKLKAEAADEEAKYRRSQVAKNLTPGAKHLLTQAIGTDPQGRCQYKPGEAARVAAFEKQYGVDLIQIVTSEKMTDGKVGRGLIVAVINALPFAAQGKPIVEPESTEVIDSEKYALPD